MAEKINYVNVLNVIAFVISWVLNSGAIGPGGADGMIPEWLRGMDELGRRYESIVTPASITFLIAHLILLLEAVFTVCQMLPKYRSSALVQEGVNVWFLMAGVAQLMWSIDLNLEGIIGSILSTVFMAIMFFCHSKILMAQASLTEAGGAGQTPEEYWILRFPFSVHCAWIFAVFVMSINGFFGQFEPNIYIQLVLGIVSLVGFAAVGLKMLYANGFYPNYVIPSILSWFAFGIAFADKGPQGDLEGVWGFIFTALSAILALTLAINTGYLFYKNEYLTRSKDIEMNEVNNDTVYINAPV